MATENELTDGFCCGQENSFGLESLVSVYDFRDYQTKSRLRSTIRTLANARQRDRAWLGKVRDAFGLPERFPATNVGGLAYGSGRIASGEFIVWPSRPRPLSVTQQESGPSGQQITASLADMILGLAWYAHSRADLISPSILETYDPERKYSFVGWPEEFRDTPAVDPADEAAVSAGTGKVLEVFGANQKLSFVGEPDAIAENIAFGFAAWRAEIALLEREVTRPFVAQHAPDSQRGRALQAVVSDEVEALARKQMHAVQAGICRCRRRNADTGRLCECPAIH